MSLRLEIKKKMLERSPRVKAIDFHNQNPWVVFGLYSGTLSLFDYSSNVFRANPDFHQNFVGLDLPHPRGEVPAQEALDPERF